MATERMMRLRLPRIVVGTVGRSSRPERVAVHDDVPVMVREFAYSEAPLVMDDIRGIHAIEGIPYVKLCESPGEPEKAFEFYAKGVMEKMLKALRNAEAIPEYLAKGSYPWSEGIGGVSKRRGLGPSSEIAFRTIEDDGIPEQSRKAHRLAGRLAIVGRTLYVPARIPRFEVRIGYRSPSLGIVAGPLPWSVEAPAAEPWGPLDFPLSRRAEAVALMDRLGDAEWAYDRQQYAYSPSVRTRYPEELALCCRHEREPDQVALSGISRGVIEALRPHLGALPLELVERWVALSHMSEKGDIPGMRAWLDDAADVRGALVASGAVPEPKPQDEKPENPLVLLDACLVRYQEIDRPRLQLGRDGDEAAILSL